MAQVKIGPSFFKKVFNDYEDWRWAMAREFVQNCVDPRDTAGRYTTSNVTIDVEAHNGGIRLAVFNDGTPMDEETLVGKLLALGESGKDFDETVGGFGRAKEILYFCHESYQIGSGDHVVNGRGGDYELERATSRIRGTHSIVHINDTDVDELVKQFKRAIVMTQRPNISFTLNGERIVGNLHKGTRRRDLSWCTIYTNKRFENRLIVRAGGVPMFTSYIHANDKGVIIELKGASDTVLTSNRDGLQWRYRRQLEELVHLLTTNWRAAMRDDTPRYTHYAGDQLTGARQTAARSVMEDVLKSAYATVPQVRTEEPEEEVEPAQDTSEIDRDVTSSEAPPLVERGVPDIFEEDVPEETKSRVRVELGYDFVVKNTLGMIIPEHFLPESFSAYSRKLLKVWTALMLEIHDLFGVSDKFSVGFLFDDDHEAEHEVSDRFGRVYYISPALVVTNSRFNSRSLSKRWKFSPMGRDFLLAAAAHEFTHRSIQTHDELYANVLTTNMAVVMNNRSRFHKCFRG